MTTLFKLLLAGYFLFFTSDIAAQEVASWKSSVTKTPDITEQQPDGTVGIYFGTEVSLKLSLRADGNWKIYYLSEKGEVSGDATNVSTVPSTIKFEVTFDTLTINGNFSPDSSEIQCVVVDAGKKREFVLKKRQTPVFWSGDTTINGKMTSLRLTLLPEARWNIYLRGNGQGTLDAEEQTNSAGLPRLSFFLYSNNGEGINIEGSISPDSLSIACTIKTGDSLSIPISLYKNKQNFEQQAAEVYSNSMWSLLYVWLGVAVLMLLFFLLRNKLSPASSDTVVEIPDDNWLQKILPLVRISISKTFLGRQRVLTLHKDALFIFTKRKKKDIAALHDTDSAQLILTFKGLGNIKKIPVDSIDKVEIEKESKLGKIRFRIYHNGKKEKFVLPGYEMPNLLKALKSLTGDRLRTGLPIRFHNYGIWIQLLVLSFGVVYLYKEVIQPGAGLLSILYFFAIIILLLRILVLLFSSISWFLDHLPRSMNVTKKSKRKVDLSCRKQFRSVPLAITLKILGAAIFIPMFLFLNQRFLPAPLKDLIAPLEGVFPGFAFVVGYFVVGMILSLSLAFANKNPKAAKPDTTRKPILYLRSFHDDRETSFQPGSMLSNFLGVDPPFFQLGKNSFNTRLWSYRFKKKFLRYFYNNHPVRIFRLLLGWPVDTSEQQLELYFRKKGPFVAIGKPGERIITTGAGRMYVTNEEWQAVILDYLQKSQLVVLQPNSTEGVWWEINQSLKLVAPDRLFLCMINYKGKQNFYEDFRLRIEASKQEIKLPRHIGNANEICFFRFDPGWKPELLKLRYRHFIYWPFVGNAADLKNSLAV